MAVQSRSKQSHWIGATADGAQTRLAKGIESMGNAKNPTTSEHTWIDGTSESNTVAYAPSWDVSGYLYVDDPASEMLHAMAWKDAKDDDTKLFHTIVKGWEPGTAPGTFKAKQYACKFSPEDEGGGSGDDDLTFSGTITASDAAVEGTFDTDTFTFTPDTTP